MIRPLINPVDFRFLRAFENVHTLVIKPTSVCSRNLENWKKRAANEDPMLSFLSIGPP